MTKNSPSPEKMEEPCSEKSLDEILGPTRRGFISQAGSVVLAAAAISPAVAACAASSCNPIRGIFKHSGDSSANDISTENTSDGGKAYRVASLDQFTENGAPIMFSIQDDMMDGWTKKLNVSIGAVWVQRLNGNHVRAFQALCPHAGCPIMYDEKTNQFYCPCHAANFMLDGTRIDPVSPSPRDMDSLSATVTEDGSVMVTFQRFKEGTSAKIAEG
ncbi:MAG: Rieske (2Fe-2S) protein [Planctomycetia bacterium]|nr:Rieske (2Fe-2S) protein [Planctomycetia bacterium]